MKRKAKATWTGTGTEGQGILTTPSSVLSKTAYSFKERFESEDGEAGTNPEELIGAAHAGCYSMALSAALEKAGYSAESIDTTAVLSLDKVAGGFAITGIKLELVGKVPNISEGEFKKIANEAKEGCPVSKALKSVPIELDIDFRS